MPDPLRAMLERWRPFPAKCLLLEAIVREGATSTADLRSAQGKYKYPSGWQSQIPALIDREGILEGTPESFRLKPEYSNALFGWVQRNAAVLDRARELYASAGAEPGRLGDAARRQLGQLFVN